MSLCSLVIFSVANQCLDLTYQLFFISIWNLLLELQCELYSYPLPHPSSSPYSQTALMFISGRLSALLIRLLAFLLFLLRPSFPSVLLSSLSSSFLISIFSLLELSCKLYMLVWQYGAVKSLSHTHTLTFTLFSRYSRKLSVCAVSVQRVMMCRTALKMDQCLHCRTDAQSLPPCISSITTQFQIHFPLLWTSCNIFFLLQLCYCNDLSLQFLQTHFLHSHYLFNFHTYSHFCLFPRSSSDSIISSFCPVHLIFIMLHTCHDCSLSLLILRNFD